MKQNDYLLNILSNLDFTNEDFRLVGLDSTNTSLETKDVYKKLDYIKNLEVFQTNGVFDEQKFDTFYDAVSIGYNDLATIDSARLLAKHLSSSKYNIFADPLSINPNGEFIIHKTLTNPTRAKSSVWGGNLLTEGPLSVREIALTLLIDDNGTLTDSPNEMGFFGDFFDTKVLATYDSDGTHVDPTTGLVVTHKKGEYKYNHNGTFYYEDLGNRDIYGKQVLSKFDIITTDGSTLNKYDFFDSDDKEKSLTGTLIKSIIKTAPAFVPGINSYYIAARIGLNSLDLFSKLGKMVSGSDSPTLSAIEGFSASLGTSVSDYALLHLWSIENLLNMGADVFLQLAEQRWLFTHLPSLLKGNQLGFSEKARTAWKEENVSSIMLKYRMTLKNLDSGTLFATNHALKAKAVGETNLLLEQILKDNYKLGEYISRAYMTGITTATGYSEAINSGATDLEATLFTLGLAAGEWGILSTRLGNWILPELQLEKARLAKVIATLHGLNPGKAAPKQELLNWAMRVIKEGKDWFTKAGFDENTGKVLAKHMVSNSLGEGFEEVTEQAWLDMSKTLFNFVNNFRDDDTKLRQTWRNPDGSLNILNTLNDYALNFVGGLIGGGLGNLKLTVTEALKLSDIKDQKTAFLELLYHIRLGNKDKLIETANKMQLGDPTKGTVRLNDFSFSDGTETDNRDLLAKQVFASYLNHLDNLVKMERSVKTDEGISLDLVFKDLRFYKLLDSKVLASYLLDYHSAVADLIATTSEIKELTSKSSDSLKLTSEEEDKLKDLKKQEAQYRKKVEEYTDGTLGLEFVKDAIFSLEKGLSDAYLPSNVLQYIKLKEISLGYNRKLSDIPQVEIEKYVKDWETLAPKLKDDFRSRRLWFEENNQLVNNSIKDHITDYLDDLDVFIGKVDKAITRKILDNLDLNSAVFGKFLEELYSNRDTPESDTNYSKRVAFMDALLQELLDKNYVDNKPLFDMFLAVRRTEREETIQPGTDYFDIIDISPTGELTTYNDIINNILSNIGQNDPVAAHQLIFQYAVSNIMNQSRVIDHLNESLKSLKYLSHSARTFLKEFIDWFITDESSKETIMETINLINYTPILNLLDNVQLSLKDDSIKFSTLISALESEAFKLSRNGKLNEFGFPDTTWEEAITHAELLGTVVLSHLVAARTDLVDPENVFSYNYTVNQLTNSDDLVTFTEDGFNILYADLAKQMNELVLYKRMVGNSATLLLNKQDNISLNIFHRLISSLKSVFFNKLSTETDNPLTSWKNSEEFKNALLSILPDTGHNLLEELKSIDGLLTAEQKFLFYKLQFELNHAIFDFILANKEKTKEEFADLFTKLISSPDQNSTTKYSYSSDIDSFIASDSNLLLKTIFSYIAAVGALSETDFSAAYIEAIKDEKKFIHSNGLYNVLYHEVSFITLKDIWDKMTFAFDALLLRDIENNPLLFDLKGDFYNELGSKRNNSTSLTFKDCFLTTGYSGTGKSTANELLLYKILKNIGDTTKKIAIVHKTLSLAEDCIKEIVSKNIGLTNDNFLAFDHAGYFKHINPNITPVDASNPKVDVDSLEQNSEDLTWHHKNEKLLNEAATQFSLVIIDEVTNISYLDLNVHQAFVETNNIRSICLGDFHLTTLMGEFSSPSNPNVVEHLLTHAHNFASTFNLTLSFRSKNKLNTNSLLTFLDISKQNVADLYTLEEYDTVEQFDPQQVQTEYLLNDNEFGGILATSNDGLSISDEIKLAIQRMIDTTTDPILVLGNNQNHPLYQYLKTLPNQSKFNYKQGVAQGLESDYAILIVDNIDIEQASHPTTAYYKFIKDVYTGISRAKIGSIVTNPTVKEFAKPMFGNSVKRTVNAASILTENIVKDFNSLIIGIFLALLNGREVKPIKLDYDLKVQPTPTILSLLLLRNEIQAFKNEIQALESEGLSPTLSADKFNSWLTSVKESNIPESEKKLLLDEIQALEQYVEYDDINEGNDFLDSDLPYTNPDKDRIIAPIYSFNAYLTGVDENRQITTAGQGNPVAETRSNPTEWRHSNSSIIGLKGLIYLLAITPNSNISKYYDERNIKVTDEAIKEFHKLYNLLYIGEVGKNPLIPSGYRVVIGFVNLNHKLSDSLHGENKSNHRLSALIVDGSGDTIVEIPLYTFPNVNSIINSYVEADTSFKDKAERELFIKEFLDTKSNLEKQLLLEKKGYTALYKLLTIYSDDFNSTYYLSLDGDRIEWSKSYDPSKSYPPSFRQVLGDKSEFLNILVLSLEKNSNGYYSYVPTPVTLISQVHSLTKPMNNIYVYPKAFAFLSDYEIKIHTNGSTTKTKTITAGKLFVIVSQDPTLFQSGKLSDLLRLVERNRACILYINCPSSILDPSGSTSDNTVDALLDFFIGDHKNFNSHQSIITFAEHLIKLRSSSTSKLLEENKGLIDRIDYIFNALTKENSNIKWSTPVTDPKILISVLANHYLHTITYGGALRKLTSSVLKKLVKDDAAEFQRYRESLQNAVLYFPFNAFPDKNYLDTESGVYSYYELQVNFTPDKITANVGKNLFDVYINGELRTCQEFGDITTLISIFDGVPNNMPQSPNQVKYFKINGYTNLYKKIDLNNETSYVLVYNNNEIVVDITNPDSLSSMAIFNTQNNHVVNFDQIYNNVINDYTLLYNNNLIDKNLFLTLYILVKYPNYTLTDPVNNIYEHDLKLYNFNQDTLLMNEIIQNNSVIINEIKADLQFMIDIAIVQDSPAEMEEAIKKYKNLNTPTAKFKELYLMYLEKLIKNETNEADTILEQIINNYNIDENELLSLTCS